MEHSIPKSFFIKLGAFHLEVLPQQDEERLYYLVTLTSKIIKIYQQPNGSNIPFWYQSEIGRTSLAEQLGFLIESHMKHSC
jgi:hypothetical protein